MVSAREQILHRLAMTGAGYRALVDAAKLLDEFARELAAADKAEPYGIGVEWPDSRAYLLQLMASWGLKTRDGSREIADKILRMHAHEMAERLRTVHVTGEGEQWNWWDAATIPDSCADLIDPKERTP